MIRKCIVLFAVFVFYANGCAPIAPQNDQVRPPPMVQRRILAAKNKKEDARPLVAQKAPLKVVPPPIVKKKEEKKTPILKPPSPPIRQKIDHNIEVPVNVPRVLVNAVDNARGSVRIENVKLLKEENCNENSKVLEFSEHREKTWQSWTANKRVVSLSCRSVACICTSKECFQSNNQDNSDSYILGPVCTADKKCTVSLKLVSTKDSFKITSTKSSKKIYSMVKDDPKAEMLAPGFLQDVRSLSCQACPPPDQPVISAECPSDPLFIPTPEVYFPHANIDDPFATEEIDKKATPCDDNKGLMYELPVLSRSTNWREWLEGTPQGTELQLVCTSPACICTSEECFQSENKDENEQTFQFASYCQAKDKCTAVVALTKAEHSFQATSIKDPKKIISSVDSVNEEDAFAGPQFIRGARTAFCGICPIDGKIIFKC
ncbi:hypothetical protein QR680_004785 [Steinernema hermaphroditum]|uniref:Phlebovirus glycoprotein G2 fusion domain-containing protein n=1 Tax=Steinernema hermaphroditum TaxID=289476 RepID=A0AA39HS07_9BILA|nr:hypothetical protein QR680_004785 [Steinernema hermaphroditum]